MTLPLLSIIVTAHTEGYLLRPTLRSIEAAAQLISANGDACELLLVLDRPDERTYAEAQRWANQADLPFIVQVLQANNGESGASRNEGIRAAAGAYVSVCDGDDIVAENFYVNAIAELRSNDAEAIVHPERVVSFGDWRLCWNVRSTMHDDLTFLDLLDSNLWPSCSLGLKDTYLEHPYPQLRPGSGYGPEDYAWNIETAAAGIHHLTAPETVFFYRTRSKGGVNNAHASSLLPKFDIDALRSNFPSRPREEVPAAPLDTTARSMKDALRKIAARSYRGTKRLAAPVLKRIPRGRKEQIYNSLQRSYRRILRLPPIMLPSDAALPSFQNLMKKASEIEPAISLTAFNFDHIPDWIPPQDGYGRILFELHEALRGRSEILLLAPWIGIGGADLVTLNYARRLIQFEGVSNRIAALTTYLPERTISHQIPREVHHVQVPVEFRTMALDRQQRLFAQLLQLLQPQLILSINCFDFTNALAEYSSQITERSLVYLSLFAWDRIGASGYPVNPITDDPQRRFLTGISGIITDNSVTAHIISDRLGLPGDLVRVHYQPAMDYVPDFDSVIFYSPSYQEDDFSHQHPFRAVWPHRLDKEKRPETLLKIARLLRERDMPVELHIHGQQVLHTGVDDVLSELVELGAVYHGPYSGGLPALPVEDYHALLLTSESEGLPLVLVQSLLLGIPVIASSVGGVTDIIRNDGTGILTNGPDDIEGFVDALESLLKSPELRRRLIVEGHAFAAAQHSVASFDKLLDAEFGSVLMNLAQKP